MKFFKIFLRNVCYLTLIVLGFALACGAMIAPILLVSMSNNIWWLLMYIGYLVIGAGYFTAKEDYEAEKGKH